MESPDIIIAAPAAFVLAILGVGLYLLMRRIRRTAGVSFGQQLLIAAETAAQVVTAALLVIILFFLGLWWVLAIFVVVEGVRKYRDSRQYGLLWLLCVSAERSMPLAPAIDAFSRERFGPFGRRARQLAIMLEAGVPLPDALEQCPGLLPPHAVPMVRIGCQSGALAPALRQAAAMHTSHQPAWMNLLGKVAYLAAVTIVGVSISIYLMVKIFPEFQNIFRGFGSPLPAVTQQLFSVSEAVIESPLFALSVLLLYILIAYALMRYLRWTQRDLPPMARLWRRLDAADVLDGLALVADRRRPMLEGIASLAKSYPKLGIRRRLRRVVGDIQAGRDWAESLYARHLIRPADLALLQAAQRAGNLAWAMRELADSNRRRFTYRVQSIAQALFPLAVILIGAVVLFVAVALFQPLVSLIEVLSRT